MVFTQLNRPRRREKLLVDSESSSAKLFRAVISMPTGFRHSNSKAWRGSRIKVVVNTALLIFHYRRKVNTLNRKRFHFCTILANFSISCLHWHNGRTEAAYSLPLA